METFHGELLIGGMRLRNLEGTIDGQADDGSDHWTGQFVLDRTEVRCLQIGRSYRLQLRDGRGAQIVVSRMDAPVGHVKLRIEFEGKSPLAPSCAIGP